MKKILTTALLTASLIAAPLSWAEQKSEVDVSQSKTTQEAIKKEEKRQTELLKTINKDVSEGMDKVVKAIQLLDEGKEKEALKALQEATGKFDVAIAANPELSLVPVDSFVNIYDLVTTPDKVKEQIKQADELLDDGKVQDAREILSTLQDEMRITTVYLPMGTYPEAIKLATKYLVDGRVEDAKSTLVTAMGTLVSEDAVIPLGLIRAASLIDQASKLDKGNEKEKIQKLITAAKHQLEIAKLLGYTDNESKAYADLNNQIENLEKEIKGKNAVEKLYEKLASSFTDLIKKESNKKESK